MFVALYTINYIHTYIKCGTVTICNIQTHSRTPTRNDGFSLTYFKSKETVKNLLDTNGIFS